MWAKRRFGCDTPGCVGSFTESTGEVAPRRRVTARLCAAMARAAWDRSTAAVAGTFGVSWATAWREIAAAARQKIALLPQRPPRRLGIDETTFGRYGSFMTGLVDSTRPGCGTSSKVARRRCWSAAFSCSARAWATLSRW